MKDKFAWHSKTSRTACIGMIIIRMKCVEMSFDEALHETLNNGHHCINPDSISSRELKSLQRDVIDILEGGARHKRGQAAS